MTRSWLYGDDTWSLLFGVQFFKINITCILGNYISKIYGLVLIAFVILREVDIKNLMNNFVSKYAKRMSLLS